MIFLLPPPKFWDCKCVPPHQATLFLIREKKEKTVFYSPNYVDGSLIKIELKIRGKNVY
jgi:hypothetical protein